jgi:hypothetical protein
LSDQTILVDDENFGNVIVCPGGVVHINLAHVSLKFLPEDFLKFADLVGKAHRKYEAPLLTDNKPRLHLVPPDNYQDKDADPND